MGFFNHLASDFLDTSAVGVSCLSALLDQCDFYFMVKKAIVDWKKLLISSIMNLVSLLFKLMDLNVQLIDLPKHMNNMDFPQRCQPYVYQGLSTLGIFSSSRKFQKTRNSSPNDGKNQIPIKKVQHKTWIPAIERLTPHQLIPNPLGFYEYMWLKVEVWLQWLLKYIIME